MVKILENILLDGVKDVFLHSYSKYQLGFVPELGCEVHLLRMISLLKTR